MRENLYKTRLQEIVAQDLNKTWVEGLGEVPILVLISVMFDFQLFWKESFSFVQSNFTYFHYNQTQFKSLGFIVPRVNISIKSFVPDCIWLTKILPKIGGTTSGPPRGPPWARGIIIIIYSNRNHQNFSFLRLKRVVNAFIKSQ